MGYRHIVLGAAIFLLGRTMPTLAQAPAAAADAGPAYMVTYVETVPARRSDTAALLRTYRQVSASSPGNLRSVVLERLDRPGQFVIATAWQSVSAWQTHLAAERIVTLRKQLAELRSAPLDDRVNTALSMGALEIPREGNAVYAVTHVDVVPTAKDDAVAALKQLGQAGRSSPGNLHFEIAQQASRPNHFTVVEAWTSRAAFDAQVAATAKITFRDQLGPMSGALYDERLYRWLD